MPEGDIPSRIPGWKSRKFAFLLIVVFHIAAALEVVHSYHAEKREAESLLSALSGSTAYQVSAALRNVDTLLIDAAEKLERKDYFSVFEAQRLLGRVRAMPEVADVIVVNKEGALVGPLVTAKPLLAVDLSDREYFHYWRDHFADDALHLSPPIVSRVTGDPRIPASRPRLAPDGSFAGVVVAAVRPEFLAEILAAANNRATGTGALLMADGTILARVPLVDSLGQKVPYGYGEVLTSGAFAFHEEVRAWDGITRYIGARPVGEYPLVVASTLSASEAMASWRRGTIETFGTSIPLSAAIFVLALMADRREHARQLLADTVTAQRDGLEIVVAARTKELADLASRLTESNQELRTSEEEIRLLLESTGEGIYGIDGEGRCIICNPAAARMLGYDSPQALLGCDTHLAFHHHRADGTAYPVLECRVHRCVAEGVVAHVDDEVFFRPDGSSFPVEYRAHPIHRDGGIIGAVVSFSDITRRRSIEAEMRIAHTVFETTDEGIAVTDADNRFTTVNPAFLRITGYAIDEVLGKTPSLLASGKHDKEYYQVMWRSLYDLGCWQGEIWNRRKDGSLYAEWLTITAIRDDSGRPLQFVAVFSDITSRARAVELVRHEANYDPLTDLPNRRHFDGRLGRLIDAAAEEGRQLALLFIDLDHFKPVNDCHGHEIGDRLLVEAAIRLKSCVRNSDFVARLGGDEFVVVLDSIASPQAASLVAGNVVDTISRPFMIEDHEIEIGASVGVAIYPADGTDCRTLIQRADDAMYAAKSSGRSCFHLAG